MHADRMMAVWMHIMEISIFHAALKHKAMYSIDVIMSLCPEADIDSLSLLLSQGSAFIQAERDCQ